MKQFANQNSFVNTSENSNVKLLSMDKITELSNLLGLEVITYDGEGTITVVASNATYNINKNSIHAFKYDDDFLFFIQYNVSESYRIIVLNSNFDVIDRVPLSNSTNTVFWYAKNTNAILFRANSMSNTNSDYSVCITKARNANGDYIPVAVYGCVTNSHTTTKQIKGNGISDSMTCITSISQTYYTLLSIAKLTFPNAQLICDYVYYPTHIGYDASPKRFLLNDETWVYTGSKGQDFPGNGLLIKLDEEV